MQQELIESDIKDILSKEWYGHLGCIQHDGFPYVVPVAYVYKDNCLYTYSFEGKKIYDLRQNPNVCFQVEKFIESDEWKSVVVWGKYIELEGKERDDALSLVLDSLWQDAAKGMVRRLLPFRDSMESMERAIDDTNVVLFKIEIEKMTGRYEQYE